MLKAKHKFHAKPTTKDTIRFASKIESRYYDHLKLLKAAGKVVGFLMQTPLHFKCGATYRLDFLVFYDDGSCIAVDIKGFSTDVFKLKAKMIEDEYPWLDFQIISKF